MTASPPPRALSDHAPLVVRRFGRFLYTVGWRFQLDECLVRASALAYTTLLSIVPLLALMFAVLKGLGAQRRLEPLLLSRLALDQEAADRIIGYIDQTNVGTLGALGAAALILTVVSVLGAVEGSFNHIWRVRRGRNYLRKLTDYSSVVLLTPLLLLAAVAVTSSLQERNLLQFVLQTEYIGTAALQGLRLLPILINAIALAILYIVMTNRRPHLPSVVVGAVVAGALWHGLQWGYVAFQIGMARYSAIYGALSQLPITLVWFYLSALVVLAGAEVAAVLEFGPLVTTDGTRASPWLIGAQLLVRAAERFAAAGGGLDARLIAAELNTEPDAVLAVADRLARDGILVAVAEQPATYVLARAPDAIPLDQLASLDDAPPVPPGCDARVRALAECLAERRQSTQTTWRLADVLNGRLG
jgi:membrane protein